MEYKPFEKNEMALTMFAKNNGITEENLLYVLNNQDELKRAVQSLNQEQKDELLNKVGKDKLNEMKSIIKSIT